MRRRRRVSVVTAGALSLALGLTACSGDDAGTGRKAESGDGSGSGPGSGPRLRAGAGFVPQPVMKDLAAGYLTVRNDGAADDRLTAVSTDLADDVTMHTTEGERMRAVDGFDVPAGGELTLARGGAHLMLEKLDRRPEVGEKVSFVLHFAESEPIEVEVPVQPTTYRPAE
ncbi:copper chaperone PCu(A)C [Streptomyces sp. NBC_01808]|uniref:copper chaperone PCu(A)C n=1 Tax=Streptomyces sp. NBC_01808 TaxID=2975947 RepID=UPI002DDA606A|nr:copper chaperone PCu(A)C [Streptomyces sp. NBC_01808]WSA38961.1 copper chaperone PCu(A)C [Streptomyces sp. NBC_01808]